MRDPELIPRRNRDSATQSLLGQRRSERLDPFGVKSQESSQIPEKNALSQRNLHKTLRPLTIHLSEIGLRIAIDLDRGQEAGKEITRSKPEVPLLIQLEQILK